MIGEDLGTVPEGFRETMRAADVLSYRVLRFERRDDGGFIPPGDYPPLAAASAATHDLATIRGFWLGRDIEWRRRLGAYPDADAERTDAEERRRDRRLLLEALSGEGLLARERFGAYLSDDGEPSYEPELGEAILVYLARSRARLTLVQIEDVADEAYKGEFARHDRSASKLAPPSAGAARRAARRAADGADRCASRRSAPPLGRRKAGLTREPRTRPSRSVNLPAANRCPGRGCGVTSLSARPPKRSGKSRQPCRSEPGKAGPLRYVPANGLANANASALKPSLTDLDRALIACFRHARPVMPGT